MEKVLTTLLLDEGIRERAEALFTDLGLDLDTAIGLFLRHCIREQGIPFPIGRNTAEDHEEAVIEMTDDEKIDFVARRILREHKAAFEELAK